MGLGPNRLLFFIQSLNGDGDVREKNQTNNLMVRVGRGTLKDKVKGKKEMGGGETLPGVAVPERDLVVVLHDGAVVEPLGITNGEDGELVQGAEHHGGIHGGERGLDVVVHRGAVVRLPAVLEVLTRVSALQVHRVPERDGIGIRLPLAAHNVHCQTQG